MGTLNKLIKEIQNEVDLLNVAKRSGISSYGEGRLECLTELLDFIVKNQDETKIENAIKQEWESYCASGSATVDSLEDNPQYLGFCKGFYRGACWELNSNVPKSIPITKEFLEKNGFRRGKSNNSDEYEWIEDGCCIGITINDIVGKEKGIFLSKKGESELSFRGEVKYVYQLQQMTNFIGINKNYIIL